MEEKERRIEKRIEKGCRKIEEMKIRIEKGCRKIEEMKIRIEKEAEREWRWSKG